MTAIIDSILGQPKSLTFELHGLAGLPPEATIVPESVTLDANARPEIAQVHSAHCTASLVPPRTK